ncbi:MAG: aromatic ring-hydroxylating dioxygenase subunit alpha [Rubrivivax sp.]
MSVYGDSARFARERSRIFEREWICVGRVEDLSARGSFLRAPLTRAGVVVVRGADDVLRAFHAVCPHRGAAFVDRAEGSTERFVCPYHGFAFELDGRACAKSDNLSPVRLEQHSGFLFVTLSSDAPPLAEAYGEAPPWLARANLSNLLRARRVAYDVEADWKIVVENFQESLHFPTVHPALEAITPSARAETWTPFSGPWLGGLMPIVAEKETVSVSGELRGRALLVPEEDRRVVRDAMRFPNLLTSLQPDYLLTFTIFPLSPERTHVIASTYAREGGDIDDVLSFWSRVYEEDRVACERQHRGAISLPREPRYTEVEEGAQAFVAMVDSRLDEPKAPAKKHCGVLGRPYVDLSPFLDITCFDELHDELTRGLAEVESSYTGGSLKWMGVCAPSVEKDPYRDYMHVIRALPRDELEALIALGDADPKDFDLDKPETVALGDETDHPLTKAQMRWLELRHGVYFPWKVCYHLLENERWEDNHSGEGKDFGEEARRVFPKTVAFIESLPFTEIGRAVVFGLMPNDHAPAHRDSEPGKALGVAQSISFQPSRGAPLAGDRHKRFYLLAPDGSNEIVVDAPIYWFSDMDFHGVHADPYFRYSIRVDGVFDKRFLARLRGR